MKPLTRLRSATVAISLVATAVSTIPNALAGEIVASQPVGSLPGSFTIGADGSATYSIPLWVPDGRAGVQPSLSLTYKGTSNGLLGVGWSVSGIGSSISRCGRTFGRDGEVRGVEFTATDYLCLDGQRLVRVAGGPYFGDQAEYRTEPDTFTKVVSIGADTYGPLSFKVSTKDGRILTFGATPESRLEASKSGGPARLGWLLTRVEDHAGNFMTYSYGRPAGFGLGSNELEFWPTSIDYTGFDNKPLNRSVVFEYEATRPDPLSGWMRGIQIKTTRRMTGIVMKGPAVAGGTAATLRRYELSYVTSPSTGRTRLQSVQTCDGAVPKVCLPSTGFTYTEAAPSFTQTIVQGASMSKLSTTDINFDARDDLVFLNSDGHWVTRRALDVGFEAAVDSGLSGTPRSQLYDIDGDGKVDLFQEQTIKVGKYRFSPEFHLSDGNTFYAGASWLTGYQVKDPQGRLADVDGDMLADYVFKQDSGHLSLYRQTQALAWPAAPQDLYDYVVNDLGHPQFHVPNTFVDIDGDGVTDALLPFWDSTSSTWKYHALHLRADKPNTPLNSGLGATLTNIAQHPCNVFADANGDGLPDVVNLQFGISLRVNHGNGTFDAAQNAVAPGQSFPGLGVYCAIDNDEDGQSDTDPGVRVVDYNQDGKQDLLLLGAPGGTARVLLSSGSTFSIVDLGIPLILGANGDQSLSKTLDHNGDGLFDFMQVTANGQIQLYVQQGTQADLLTGAIDGLGGQQYVTYTPFSRTSPDDYMPSVPCPHPQRCYVGPIPVVTEEWADDGTSLVEVATHEYEDARADTQGAGWLGFRYHRTFDPRTLTTTQTTISQDLTNATGPCRYPARGLPVEIDSQTLDISNQELIGYRTLTRTQYTTTAGCFTYPSSTKTFQNESSAGNPLCATFDESFQCPYRVTSATASGVDAHGNIATTVTTVGPSSVYASSTHARTTTQRTYSNDTSTWTLGLVQTETTTSDTPQGSQTRSAAYGYSGGLLVSTTREPTDTGSLYLHVTTVRNAQGLPTSVSTCTYGGACRTETTEYDTDGIRATKITNAMGHFAKPTWHAGLGVVLETKNANDVPTSFDYDGFGRLRATDRADGSWSTVDYQSVFPFPLVAITQDSDGQETGVYSDRIGHERLRTSVALNDAVVRVETEYDNLGRVASVSRPHFLGSDPVEMVYQYDHLGRTVKVCRGSLAGPCKLAVYSKLDIDSYDEDGVRTTKKTDASGTEVKTAIYPDGPQSQGKWTTLRYGAFGTLTSQTDAQLDQVAMVYDTLGRRTRLDDADLGFVAGVPNTSVVTAYNAFGDIVSEKDAKGQVTTMSYDALGRLTQRSAPDGTDYFVFDSAAHGKGKLASRSRAGTTTAFAYDALSRVSHEAWTIDGATYDYDYSYDALGRLQTLAYPNAPGRPRFVVDQVYDGQGHLTKVRDVSVPAAPVALWTVNQADAEGRVTTETLGNTLVTQRTYEPDTGRLSHTSTGASDNPGSIHNVEYTYQPNGNLAGRTNHGISAFDTQTTRSETFAYDGANRLTAAAVTGGAPHPVTYGYDAIGNLTMATDTPQCTNFVYGGAAAPHRLVQVTCFGTVYGVQYDANGNETSTVNPDYRETTWTSFDKPAEVHSRWGRMAYAYDANHVRVRKTKVPGALSWANQPQAGTPWNDGLSGVWSTTIYAGSLYEKRSGPSMPTVDHVYYVTAGGSPIGQMMWRQDPNSSNGDEQWRYFHTDFQGSVERTSDETASFAEAASYDAWGQRRHADWAYFGGLSVPPDTRVGYTGHMEDDEWELSAIDMGGRLYDPFFKRFTSPDSVVQAPEYGPSWNRYSYVLDNPLRYTDPTGHYAASDGSSFFGGVFQEQYTTYFMTSSAVRFFLMGDGRGRLSNPEPAFGEPFLLSEMIGALVGPMGQALSATVNGTSGAWAWLLRPPARASVLLRLSSRTVIAGAGGPGVRTGFFGRLRNAARATAFAVIVRLADASGRTPVDNQFERLPPKPTRPPSDGIYRGIFGDPVALFFGLIADYQMWQRAEANGRTFEEQMHIDERSAWRDGVIQLYWFGLPVVCSGECPIDS